MEDLQSLSHTAWECKYDVVWIPTLKISDIAIYRAKNGSAGNKYQLYTPAMDENSLERLKSENMLR